MKNTFLAIFAVSIVLTSMIACNRNRDASVSQAAPVQQAVPYTIEVGGSTSVTPLMELFAAEYQTLHPHIRVNINGTGSGDGIRNAGILYQIGMSSRDLTPAEQGQGLNEITVAIDGIAVIVNNGNPVGNLTVDQIRDIYTGAVTDWSQVSGGTKSGRIAVISREAGSGTRGAFEEIVGFQDRLVAGANESTSTGAIKASVAQNEDAIGYISIGSVDNTIKTLSVDGSAPESANVVNGSYRIARPFIVLTGDNIHAESAAFVDWMLTSAGQAIVSRSWISVR
ncbi:MAG: phosphate ABC transporter substrate-binding protein [Treponema sp.]|nr:phosphate ABC transporter substrate-binding protein [Treponema sp.]